MLKSCTFLLAPAIPLRWIHNNSELSKPVVTAHYRRHVTLNTHAHKPIFLHSHKIPSCHLKCMQPHMWLGHISCSTTERFSLFLSPSVYHSITLSPSFFLSVWDLPFELSSSSFSTTSPSFLTSSFILVQLSSSPHVSPTVCLSLSLTLLCSPLCHKPVRHTSRLWGWGLDDGGLEGCV